MTTSSLYSRRARSLAAVIAIIAAGSIALRIGLYLSEGEGMVDATWWLLRFFTILTNLLVAGTFLAIAAGRNVAPAWLLSMAASIAGVGIVYHAALARFLEHHGWEIVADQGVHTAAPILTVLWFVTFAPRAGLNWWHVPLVIIWPSLYCGYALLRGHIEGDYPYFFIDANTLGAGELAFNIFGLTLFFVLLGAILNWTVRLRDSRVTRA